jgi:hypothetical protein
MAFPALSDLALFMALVLVLSLYGLAVAGHFPVEHRSPSLRTTGGAAILWGTIALAVLLAIATLAIAWQRLPIYAAVIGGGMALLAAPLLLQPFPDTFVNGRRGLLSFAGLALLLALLARAMPR